MNRAYSVPEDYLDIIKEPSFNARPPLGGAVFYSDDSGWNRKDAENYAQRRSALGAPTKTLEQTAAGRWLEDQGLYELDSPIGPRDANYLWQRTSKRYAENAVGDARCFVTDSPARSVFRSVELPALLHNPNITALNGVPKQKLADLYAQDSEAAFKLIEAADIALRAEPIPTPPAPSLAAGGGGPLQVVQALNQIVCTGCPIPQPLMVTTNQTVFGSSQLCATIADCTPMVNIMPFGPCAFTPAPASPSGGPCVPKPAGLWQPGSALTSIQKIPSLRQTDTLQCASGGIITILFPGQTHTFVT